MSLKPHALGGFVQQWSLLLFHCSDQHPPCTARACKGRLLGWRALPACLGVSLVTHPLGLLTHSCYPTAPNRPGCPAFPSMSSPLEQHHMGRNESPRGRAPA